MNSLELLSDLYTYPQHIRVKMADGSVFNIKQYNELLHQRIPKKEVEEYEAEEDAKIEKERFELNGQDVPEILHVMESLRIPQKVDSEDSLKDILLRIRIYPIEFVITDFEPLLTQISKEKPTDDSDIKSTIYFYFLRYAILYEMIHRLDYFIKAKVFYKQQIKEIKSLREALYPVLNGVLLKAIGILKDNLRNVTSNRSFYENISKLLLELIYEEDYVINNVTFRYQIDAAFNMNQGDYYDSLGSADDDYEDMLFLAKRRLSRKLVSKKSSKKSQSKKLVKQKTKNLPVVKKLVKRSTTKLVKRLTKRSPVKKLVKRSTKRPNKHM